MMPGLLVFALVLGLVVSAVTGPLVLRKAAPLLMQFPRLAIGVLLGIVASWLLGVLALGPMLAWLVSGPAVLPGTAGEVCQRCLAAANPFGTPFVETSVPVVALLALPTLGMLVHSVSIHLEARGRRHASRRTALDLAASTERARVLGQWVLVSRSRQPFAVTLPRRHGGIVVSRGALDVLSTGELAAVLAHEQAHLDQRHHLVTSVMASLTRRLRWVPLLAAAHNALGHYVEIAADDAARRHAGTRTLASALLALGEIGHARLEDAFVGALQVNGPDRVLHLVRPGSGMAGMLAAMLTICFLTSMSIIGATVHVPYAFAAVTGCV